MFKKSLLVFVGSLLIISSALAGIKLKTGTTNLSDSPSNNNTGFKEVTHYGLGLDIRVPFLGLNLILEYLRGQNKKDNEELIISETNYGLIKEFGIVIKPFFGFGVSNRNVEFDNGTHKDKQDTNGTWFSGGLNASLALLQLSLEYRYTNSQAKDFTFGDEINRGVNLSSTSRTISFGLGLGF